MIRLIPRSLVQLLAGWFCTRVCALPLHKFGCTQNREKLTILQLVILLKAGTAVLGNPSTLPPQEEELVQLLS